jgi:dihydrofolate reductase
VTKVVLDISMSLDGFVTAANVRPEEPLGDGGERLHAWLAGDERDRAVLAGGAASLGAVIAGRRTYDQSIPWWGPDGPSGAARVPVFVVTHQPPDEVPERGVYTFVSGGIHATLEAARAAAGDRVVCVMGGAETARAFLAAGLVDEISIHLVPVLFGAGTRLFDEVPAELANIDAIQTPAATHLRFAVR